MTSKNRYKFTFGDKKLTLTTDRSNLFMEEVERAAKKRYEDLKELHAGADDATLAFLLAINCLSTQLEREIAIEKDLEELEELRQKMVVKPRKKAIKKSEEIDE